MLWETQVLRSIEITYIDILQLLHVISSSRNVRQTHNQVKVFFFQNACYTYVTWRTYNAR